MRPPVILRILLLCSFVFFANPTFAMTGPEEILEDTVLEERAKNLYFEVRCPVCDFESIADSNAEISHSLREHIRRRILAGDSDWEILYDLRKRFGNNITMTPPLNERTYILWFFPFGLILAGATWVLLFVRKASRS